MPLPDGLAYYVELRGRCPKCHGNRVKTDANGQAVFDWHCRKCYRTYSRQEMDATAHDDKQPCGHDWKDLSESEVVCDECDGLGRIDRTVSLADALRELGIAVS